MQKGITRILYLLLLKKSHYMKKSLLFIFLALGLNVFGQNNKQAKAFEKELNIFRYSLYHTLEGFGREKIMQFKFDASDSIVTKINSFCDKNQTQIDNYRHYLLKKHAGFQVNLSKCVTDSSVVNQKTIYMINELSKKQLIEYSISRLLYINPFSLAQLLMTIIQTRDQLPSKIAVIKMKEQIAQPIIQTKLIDKNDWEILIDKYDYIYRFRYNLQNGQMKIVEVLRRKQ